MQKELEPVLYLVDDEFSRTSLLNSIKADDLHIKEFADVNEFIASYDASLPGCLVIGANMLGVSAIEAQKLLLSHKLHLPIIFVATFVDIALAIDLMKMGVFDLLTRPFNRQRLLDTISLAIDKDRFKRSHLAKFHFIDGLIKSLSNREKEVAELIVQGFSNKKIAITLSISIKTVELHRSRVMAKMEASSLANLVTKFLQHEHYQDEFF